MAPDDHVLTRLTQPQRAAWRHVEHTIRSRQADARARLINVLPLAHLFRVPRYYSMGALFIVIPVLTMLVVSEPILIGNVQAWYVLPSVGCGVVGVVTAAASFWEVRGFLRAAISPAVEPA
jgi:hypothetical protein